MFTVDLGVLYPGQVVNTAFDATALEMPKGRIGLMGFMGEVIDEAGASVPLDEVYNHHVAAYIANSTVPFADEGMSNATLANHRALYDAGLSFSAGPCFTGPLIGSSPGAEGRNSAQVRSPSPPRLPPPRPRGRDAVLLQNSSVAMCVTNRRERSPSLRSSLSRLDDRGRDGRSSPPGADEAAPTRRAARGSGTRRATLSCTSRSPTSRGTSTSCGSPTRPPRRTACSATVGEQHRRLGDAERPRERRERRLTTRHRYMGSNPYNLEIEGSLFEVTNRT